MLHAETFDRLLSTKHIDEPLWRPADRLRRRLHITNFDKDERLPPLPEMDGITPEIVYVETKDGLKCRGMILLPPGPHVGTVWYVGGLGSTLEMCQPLLTSLALEGYKVVQIEHEGMAGSGRRGPHHTVPHIESFDAYRETQVQGMCRILSHEFVDGKPVYLWGHSLGAAILTPVLPYLPHYPCLLVAPFIETPRIPREGRQARITMAMLRAVVSAGFGNRLVHGGRTLEQQLSLPFEGNPYTTNREGWERVRGLAVTHRLTLAADPSTNWCLSYLRDGAVMRAMPSASIRQEVRVVLPDDERIVVPETAVRLYKDKCAPGRVSFHELPERHDPEFGSPDTLATLRDHLRALAGHLPPVLYHGLKHAGAGAPVYH